MSGTVKFTLAFLLLGLAGIGNAKTNACVDECTWMAAQVAGCSGMDINCACTTSLFQSSFRECVERSCSFADASEGTRFFENACTPHHRVNANEHALVEESDYYGPDSIEDVRHGHAYHGHRHGHMRHARAVDATEAQSEATTPAPTRSEPAGRIDAASSAATGSSETSSVASTEPTTTASEASSSGATSPASSSHGGTTSSHTGSSSQSSATESSKAPSTSHTGTTTSETSKATSSSAPAATEHSSSATEPTVEPTSNTVGATETPSVSASAVAASGTTLVVGGGSVSSGLGATGVSINPSVVTPTLPSGHFDPAPTSSGAEVVKPLANFAVMAWVAIAGVAAGALVL